MVVGLTVAVGVCDTVAVEVAVAVVVLVVAVGDAGGVFDGDVQPLIDTRAREPIKSRGNAYLSGVLMYRFIILTIEFIDSSPL